MPTVEVSCTVANCVFHAEGNICAAEKILIDMDSYANKKGDTEFSAEFDASKRKEEESRSSHTCCQTFKPKEGE